MVRLRSKRGISDGSLPAALPLLTVFLAFVAVDIIFLLAAIPFRPLQNVRVNFVFDLPSNNWPTLVISYLSGLAILQSKTWILPVFFGLILTAIVSSTFAYSGRGSDLQQVMPLWELRFELGIAGFLLSLSLITYLMLREKRQSQKAQIS